jgi:MFS family permease
MVHLLCYPIYQIGTTPNNIPAVIKPLMAKFADVLGRLEAFCLAIFLFIIGYVQMAASSNVETFAAAQIFYSAGGTGLQILQQVFIADISDLLNRALCFSLPDVPFLVTVWVGPIASQKLSSV